MFICFVSADAVYLSAVLNAVAAAVQAYRMFLRMFAFICVPVLGGRC